VSEGFETRLTSSRAPEIVLSFHQSSVINIEGLLCLPGSVVQLLVRHAVRSEMVLAIVKDQDATGVMGEWIVYFLVGALIVHVINPPNPGHRWPPIRTGPYSIGQVQDYCPVV